VFVSFGASVKADDCGCGSEVLDEGPAVSRGAEEVHWVGRMKLDVFRGVVLEDEVEFKGDFADALEHEGVLQVIGIRAEPVKDVVVVDLPQHYTDGGYLEYGGDSSEGVAEIGFRE
jgi:hypothetical protein